MFIYNDGGRADAAYKGHTSDCVVRAIAIATEQPYRLIYEAVNEIAKRERPRKGKSRSNSRTGVYRGTIKRYMESIGWQWTPTMFIGSGCKVHVRKDELPHGNLVLSLSRHFAAFIDGNLHDTDDCSRNGTRCVYGYYSQDIRRLKEMKENGRCRYS